MSRTSTPAVEAILGGNYDGSSSLTGPMEAAAILVDRIAAKDTAGEMTAAALEIVERYLSAHYYTLMDPLYTSKSTGGASGSFVAVSYWEEAKKLDATGLLANLDKPERPKASVSWLGKPPSEQIDYEDRD